MSKKEKKETPAAILKWNWGAFVFGWIWGIFNRVWISLLTLVPFVNIVMIVVLGVKGNEWAWQKSSETDVNTFLKRQRKWNIAAAIYALFWVLLIVVVIVIGIIQSDKTEKKLLDNLNQNNAVISLLGAPVNEISSFESGYDTAYRNDGKPGFFRSHEFDAKNNKTSAHILELWLEYENEEFLVYLEVTPKGGDKHVLVTAEDIPPAKRKIVIELLDKLDTGKK